MTNLAQHPRIFFQEWNNSLEAIRDALKNFPQAQTICLIQGDAEQSFPDTSSLELGLKAEMVAAAEYQYLAKEALKLIPPGKTVQPITTITGPLSIFKAEVLRTNFVAIDNELSGVGSPSDISAILNRLGYSSVSIATDHKPPAMNNIDVKISEREWDGYIAHVENDWNSFEKTAAAHFNSLLDPQEYSRVLIDASGMEPKLNGTSRNALSFLDFLNKELAIGKLKWNVTVSIPDESMNFFGNQFNNFSLVNSLNELTELFDLGICITPITTIERCLSVSKLCLRWVVQHLDIIAVRSLPFLSQQSQAQRAINLYLENADGVIFISSSSQQDATEYFNLSKEKVAPQHVFHLGAPISKQNTAQINPDNAYFLILGNDHPHKQVEIAVDELMNAGFNVISFSSSKSRGSRHKTITPGTVSDSEMNRLIQESIAVVFPSLYEGFGLPIAEAANLGKQVILWDTKVSHEVSLALGTFDVNYFCSSTSEIVTAARSIIDSPMKVPVEIRTIDQFNAEVVFYLSQLLSSPINSERLNSRWKLFNLLSSVSEQAKRDVIRSISQQHWRTRIAKLFTKKFG